MRLLMVLCCFLLLPQAIASTATGVVTQIRASESTDLILFTVNGNMVDSPRCNETSTYNFRLAAPGGLTILELLKMSLINKIEINVIGLNTCSRGFKSEGVQEVSIG